MNASSMQTVHEYRSFVFHIRYQAEDPALARLPTRRMTEAEEDSSG
jgi:hypothetical protein